MFLSIGQPFQISLKPFPPSRLSLTLQGTPTNSEHSHLEYWGFAQQWRSMETSLLEKYVIWLPSELGQFRL